MVTGKLLKVKRPFLWALGVVWALGFLAGCDDNAALPVTTGENGIPIAPEFQAFYQAHGGQAVLGEPLTEMFVAAPGERPLQYFQNMRLEYDAAADAVVVTPLGAWELGGLNEQIPAPTPDDGASLTFPGSAYGVRDAFLRFYVDHDGQTLLGLPISAQLNVEGKRVQYFENGRLDWQPGAPPSQRIQLGDLGQTHFDNEMVFAYQEMRLARPVSSAGVDRVKISAYVKSPVLYAGDDQMLYVTVLTPGGNPVANVVVSTTINTADQTQTITSAPTDDLGQVALPLNFAIPPGEEVIVKLTALDGNGRSLGETVLSYKTWW